MNDDRQPPRKYTGEGWGQACRNQNYSTCHQKDKMERVKAICADAPIFTLKPFHKKKAAIITTGNEVYHGRIEDTFTPVIREKLAEYDTEVIFMKLLMMIIKRLRMDVLRRSRQGQIL